MLDMLGFVLPSLRLTNIELWPNARIILYRYELRRFCSCSLFSSFSAEPYIVCFIGCLDELFLKCFRKLLQCILYGIQYIERRQQKHTYITKKVYIVTCYVMFIVLTNVASPLWKKKKTLPLLPSKIWKGPKTQMAPPANCLKYIW